MRPLLALLSLIALPLSAQVLSTIEIDPPAPDSSMPVQVHLAGVNTDACVPSNPTVRVDGGLVTIHVEPRKGACAQVPTPWGERIDLGRLVPGGYDVTVIAPAQFEGVTLGTAHFVVSDANQPFDVLPSVAPIGGGQVQLKVSVGEPLCAPSAVACAEVEAVTIGGKAAQFSVTDAQTIVATAPPHAAGAAVVEVKVQDRTAMDFTAFRYFDPNAAPDPAAFDRVLFPVFFSGPGAFGSFWETRAAIENRADGFVGEWRTVTEDPSIPCLSPVPCRGPVHPGAAAYALTSLFSRPQGLLYFPERRNAASLRYALHIRDTSRSAQDLGTQIPVVTPRDTTFDISLLDIPTDARYRRTLRIFDIDGVERNVTVFVLPMGDPAPGKAFSVALSTGCADPVCDAPAFASVNLDPIVANFTGVTAVRVHVSSPAHDARLFAVVTVTNNDTQHVTAY
ncbi:MAG TPA: hypothetical protein VG323_06730 [Thermoanaerobaculia bacterium]|nr:hypothetical protein [Thermoanaerobaculia bacterium]